MKSIFVIFAFCLVAVNTAAIEDELENFEVTYRDLSEEIKNIAIETTEILQQQLEEIVLDPILEVNDAMTKIEALKEQNEVCVAEEEEEISSITSQLFDDWTTCIGSAAKTSVEIVTDVGEAAQKIIFGGIELRLGLKKCRSYKYAIRRSSCMTAWSVKATLYLTSTRKSIKTIKKATNQRIPAVFDDANTCTNGASGKAVADFDAVTERIRECISEN